MLAGPAPDASAAGAPRATEIEVVADTPTRQLDLALTDLAEVFAVYPFRATMPACAHCVSSDDLRALARQPGRIPASVLDRFVTKSMVTWGDPVDFKRLLPEVLARTCNRTLGPPESLVGARLP